jgi:hypothetical protein
MNNIGKVETAVLMAYGDFPGYGSGLFTKLLNIRISPGVNSTPVRIVY